MGFSRENLGEMEAFPSSYNSSDKGVERYQEGF
jgi:hypothetical protein